MDRVSVAAFVALTLLLGSPGAHSQDSPPPSAQAEDGGPTSGQRDLRSKLQALHWVAGPTTVKIAANSSLQLPKDYVFLDAADTSKFEELTHNLSGGKEVLVTPRSNKWVAYLEFSDEGLVKDDDKIDADAILASLRRANENANDERRRRGWASMEIAGWAQPPAYNSTTKRLEWATLLRSNGEQDVNFYTKILGRRGYTTVILAADPTDQAAAIGELNGILTGYSFDNGERYADWKPGDKVAAVGLTGLIVGGAAVAAAKSGLLKGLVAALVAGWKLVVAGFVAVAAWVRSLFSRKKPTGTI